MAGMKKSGPIAWKEEYMVHVPVIDEHHKKFVGILNNLYSILISDPCKEKISEIFFALLNYAEHHLLQEEIYFKNYRFPGFQQHKESHKQFIDRIGEFQDDYAEGKEDVCVSLYKYLREWFEHHILQYDHDAVKFLVEKGFGK